MKKFSLIILLISSCTVCVIAQAQSEKSYTSIEEKLKTISLRTHNQKTARIKIEPDYELDSIISIRLIDGTTDNWENSYREAFFRNENETTIVNSIGNGKNEWIYYSKNFSKRSNALLLDQYWKWEKNNQEWKEDRRNEWGLDDQGNHIYWEFYRTENDVLIGAAKETYELNEQYQRALTNIFEWDESLDEWVQNLKEMNTYNENSNLSSTELIKTESNGESIFVKKRSSFSYNELNFLVSDSIYERNSISDFLTLEHINEYVKNEDGLVTSDTCWSKNEYNQFGYTWSSNKSYDDEGKLSSYESYQWDDLNSQWIFYYTYQFKFDERDNLLSTQVQHLVDEYGFRFSYEYDELDRQVISMVHRYDYGLNDWIRHEKTTYNHGEYGLSFTETYSWNENSEEWKIEQKKNYYYSKSEYRILNTDQNFWSRNEFSVFPNPAIDFIKVISQSTLDSIEIRTMSGQLVKKNEVIQEALNVSDLQSGLYILTAVTKDQKSFSKRFIKR